MSMIMSVALKYILRNDYFHVWRKMLHQSMFYQNSLGVPVVVVKTKIEKHF